MASRLQIPGDDSVTLRVTHSNMKSFSSDIRLTPQVGFFQVFSLLCFTYLVSWILYVAIVSDIISTWPLE